MNFNKIGFCCIILMFSIAFCGCWFNVPHECDEITTENLDIGNVQITSSELITDDPDYNEYCKVMGKVNERTGIDGKTYAISFEFRMPVDWNERFMYQGNGGADGSVVPALGGSNAAGADDSLKRGFAVISTDAGHNGSDPANADFGLAQGVAFGLDPQARSDYGYNATGTMAPIAKDIIKYYYGKKPKFSYMIGCSNGGRHGMVAASRFPEYFDGILAGAPGFNLPRTAVQHAWDVQSFQTVTGDMRTAFTPADLLMVADSVLEACDGLDGVEDGIVADLDGCQEVFDLSTSGLTDAQVAALSQSMGGPKNSCGKQLYSDWPYDPGIGCFGWALWKTSIFNFAYPLIVTLGGGSLSYVFTTPPTETPGTEEDLLAYLTNFDFDIDAPKIYARTSTYKESAMEFMTPLDVDNPKLKKFRKAGGKLLIYHGASDAAFSVNDSINWYEKLQTNYRGRADDFVRLFVIPGMTHCSGGCATDQFDALTALIDWVENGIAPDDLTASVNPDNGDVPVEWSSTRTRPLCVWPKIPVYIGGDVDSAESFACQVPGI